MPAARSFRQSAAAALASLMLTSGGTPSDMTFRALLKEYLKTKALVLPPSRTRRKRFGSILWLPSGRLIMFFTVTGIAVTTSKMNGPMVTKKVTT